jgi:predicted transcriptional regulator
MKIRQMQSELAQALGVTQQAVSERLQKLGLIQKECEMQRMTKSTNNENSTFDTVSDSERNFLDNNQDDTIDPVINSSNCKIQLELQQGESNILNGVLVPIFQKV